MNVQRSILTSVAPVPRARIVKSAFGTLADGRIVDAFTLANSHGVFCRVITYGATITSLCLPDRDGVLSDVVLGYDELAAYVAANDYAGATIGRVANRIRDGRFELNGKRVQLSCNEGGHHLHGGFHGFDKAVWKVSSISQTDGSVSLIYNSPDAAEGYPGNLTACVTYLLSDDNELRINYRAITNQPTPVNLTNHTYFNLEGSGDILNHNLMMNADHFTPLDSSHIPTGAILPVAGTPADFRMPQRIGSRLIQNSGNTKGFNHNYVVNRQSQALALAAKLFEPRTGRSLELWTDQPGLQFYSGHYLQSGPPGKAGRSYGPHSGLCLEPQHFPDAVNQPHFPAVILLPGQVYQHTTIWKFSTI